MYMREYCCCCCCYYMYMQLHRAIDWTITVPLYVNEILFILEAAKATLGPMGLWLLLIETVVMFVFGYAGETNVMDPWVAGVRYMYMRE